MDDEQHKRDTLEETERGGSRGSDELSPAQFDLAAKREWGTLRVAPLTVFRFNDRSGRRSYTTSRTLLPRGREVSVPRRSDTDQQSEVTPSPSPRLARLTSCSRPDSVIASYSPAYRLRNHAERTTTLTPGVDWSEITYTTSRGPCVRIEAVSQKSDDEGAWTAAASQRSSSSASGVSQSTVRHTSLSSAMFPMAPLR